MGAVTPYSNWLDILAWVAIGVGVVSALPIVLDIARGHRQRMAVMEVVWPVTALYFGPIATWAYWRWGRMASSQSKRMDMQHGSVHESRPSVKQASLSVSHCGAGCTLGDIVGAFIVFGAALAIAGAALYPEFILEFFLAFTLGIAFQYWAIVPMQHLSPMEGLRRALIADTASIVTFEIGLFGWMALVYFVVFTSPHLTPDTALYWFMMQIGMVLGFVTAYPANIVLLTRGLKERMG
jgi:hypothetical protein